jgi:hypothetical protein
MATVYWDVETYSQISLTDRGADIYAADPATGIFFFCYAIDDGEVQVWRPGDPVPEPFANSTGYKFVSDNWEFERAIHASILITRYGFPTLPTEQQDCAQRLALANAYPAELGLRCEASPASVISPFCWNAARTTFVRRVPPTTVRACGRYSRKNAACCCSTRRSTHAASAQCSVPRSCADACYPGA